MAMNEPAQSSGNVWVPPSPAPSATGGAPGGRKEVEVAPLSGAEPQLREVGYDVELPKEVAAAGVKGRPVSVPVSASVSDMGVKPRGTNVPPSAQAVSLPLTDDQIAVGLTRGINQSFRWLAQWCLRRLDQLHISFRVIGGKVRRKA